MIDNNDILLIAGPCSAESEHQLRMTVQPIKDSGKLSYFRAGLWKPRSQPGSFEGVGKVGLDWMASIKRDFGTPIITEVANARHAELCMKAGFDALWIGARTAVNPFYVQEIAEALKGVPLPIFVKNPVNPDLKLWLGAIERMEKSTGHKVYPIHRGFNLSGNTRFRNSPHWQIPIELKTLRPELELVCDPSHISGRREYIFEIAQKAFDLHYSGLMVETHYRPLAALSDSRQQISPEDLIRHLNQLTIPRSEIPSGPVLEKLKQFREEIDDCDARMLQLLSRRMQISESIGDLKSAYNISVLQPERWQSILTAALRNRKELGLSEEFIDQLFKAIHDESIDRQTATGRVGVGPFSEKVLPD